MDHGHQQALHLRYVAGFSPPVAVDTLRPRPVSQLSAQSVTVAVFFSFAFGNVTGSGTTFPDVHVARAARTCWEATLRRCVRVRLRPLFPRAVVDPWTGCRRAGTRRVVVVPGFLFVLSI
jgi:hypothetical protein